MDDSLDDFFAKKDKSKKKTKTKSSKTKIVAADLLPSTPPNESSNTAEDLAQQVAGLKVEDESSDAIPKEKKKTRRKKDKDGSDDVRRKEDEEWVAPEEEVDYSGLRIANKSLAKSAADDANDDGTDSEAEYDEHGQLVPRSSEGSVWRTVTPGAGDGENEEAEGDDATDSAPAPVATPETVELPNVSGGKYIPPSLRGGNKATARTADGELAPISMKRTHRKKVAPNITSQEDFPTLGAAPPPPDPDTSNFERVRGGASTQYTQSRSSAPQRVETRNMFSALR